MIRDQKGKILKLRHPNPLMEHQSATWKEAWLDIYNIENLGQELQTASKTGSNNGNANLENLGEQTVIRNQDGTPLKLNGKLDTFDTENPDQDFMHGTDQEIIQLSGSPIYYYRVHIDESNYDPLYMESRNKIRAQHGVEIYANWEPVTPTNDMGVYGIDSPDEVNFNFNVREFREKTGDDLPKVGALIYTPFDKNWWEVIQYGHGGQGEDFKLWGKYRFVVLGRKYQESLTDEEPTRPEPNRAARDIIIR